MTFDSMEMHGFKIQFTMLSLFYFFCHAFTDRVRQVLRVQQVKQDQLAPRDLQESLVQRVCVESLDLL